MKEISSVWKRDWLIIQNYTNAVRLEERDSPQIQVGGFRIHLKSHSSLP